MEHKNRIKSLHQTDETTAQKIMKQYPAQWDLDKVFKKTYQKYLSLENETLQADGVLNTGCAEAATCTKEIRTNRRLWKAGGYVLFAAAYIGMFLFFFRMGDTAPSTDRFPDGIIDSDMLHLEVDTVENTTSTGDNASAETESITAVVNTEPFETTYVTEAVTEHEPEDSTEQTEQTTSDVQETEATDSNVTESELPQPTETQTPNPTEVMTAPPVTETEPPAVTSTPEPESTTTETTTTTTEEPPVISLGHFEVNESSGSGTFSQITYVRENTAAVEEHEHSFDAEGFTVTGVQEKNPDYEFRSVVFSIEDESGQHYSVEQVRYAYFALSFNPKYEWKTRSYDVGGKSVFLLYQEDENSVCTLMWDDGCHICIMYSQLKDLEKMECLVENQIAY